MSKPIDNVTINNAAFKAKVRSSYKKLHGERIKFARKAGIDNSYLGRYLAGDCQISAEKVEIICDNMGWSKGDYVTYAHAPVNVKPPTPLSIGGFL